MLSFGVSVAVNNLLALKAFNTYLANYQQHEMPKGVRQGWLARWIEKKTVGVLVYLLATGKRQRLLVKMAKNLVAIAALNTMDDLTKNLDAKSASVSLNDVQPGMFAILYAVQNPQYLAEVKTGKELFQLISNLELEFALVKKPREGTKYQPNI